MGARGLLLLCLGASLGMGCDVYGLPPYREPQTPTPRPGVTGGILDIDPKFGRLGDKGLEVVVYGLHSNFNDAALVEIPDDTNIKVVSVTAKDLEELKVVLDIGPKATVGVHPFQVTTTADGTMPYRGGFTVVE